MNKKLLTVGLIIGLVVGIGASVGLLVNAFSGSPKVVVEGDYIEAPDNSSGDNLGKAYYDKQEFQDASVEGKFTVNRIALGNEFSGSLDFSNGNTTTPGKIGSLLNDSGKDRLCTRLQVKFTSASDTGGLIGTGSPFTFTVSTSSAATTFSAASGGLIASTTIATGTTPLIDSIVHKGTGVNTAGQTWIWANDAYINFALDGLYGGLKATSSAAIEELAAKYYIHCIDQ